MHLFVMALCVGLCGISLLSAADQGKAPVDFLVKTDLGEFTLRLFPDKAPVTVENFRQYVREGFYNGTIFHRVIPDFMIQGGGFTPEMTQKPTRAAIKNEAQNGLKNKRGSIAMARTSDINSATAQFFINTVDNAFLDNRGTGPAEYGYAVFGEVTKGMDVVDKIRKVSTGSKQGHQNVPQTPVVIQEIKEIS